MLDAGSTALIPLRPLTLIEILDAGFVVLRRRPRVMLGLPLALFAAVAGQAAVAAAATYLLGELTSSVAVIVLAVLGQLVAGLIAVAAVIWVSALLTRTAIQTLLGPGFAPAPRRPTLRSAVAAIPGVLGLTLLQGVGIAVMQSALSVVSLLILPTFFLADPALQWISQLVVAAALVIVACGAYSYLTLATPAYMAESRHIPGWIGKPWRTTGFVTAFGRSFVLVGWRNLWRAALVLAGTVVICSVVIALGFYTWYALLSSLVYTFDRAALEVVISSPEVVLVIWLISLVASLSVSIGYVASVQTALYLDLRMRREGLDLALRFDAVGVPQPSAAPGRVV